MPFGRRHLIRTLSFALLPDFVASRLALGLAAQTAPQGTSPPAATHALPQASPGASEREKVTGIGGLFFGSHDPSALAHWYQQNLGISLTPTSFDQQPWQQETGPTLFTPFKETTTYFGDASKLWMINFRVRDLEKMAAQLQAAGIAVKVDSQSYGGARFAHLHDPEGNPIELWQPAPAHPTPA